MKRGNWPLYLLLACAAALLFMVSWLLLSLALDAIQGGFGEAGDFERWMRTPEGREACLGAGVSWVFPVAYDWKRGAAAVARHLPFGDECLVAWDSGGRTWGGGSFVPPTEREFRACVAEEYRKVPRPVGHAHAWSESRLRIFAGPFAVPGQKRLALQRCERRALAHLCREGNVVVPVDADEEWIEPHRVLPALQGVGKNWVGCGDIVHVYGVAGDSVLVLTAAGAPVAWHREDDSGVKGAAGMRKMVGAKIINWWLANRSVAEMRLKLGAVSYMEGHDPGHALKTWAGASVGDVPNVGGTLQGKRLQSIAVADLRAGNWGSLSW